MAVDGGTVSKSFTLENVEKEEKINKIVYIKVALRNAKTNAIDNNEKKSLGNSFRQRSLHMDRSAQD